MIPYFVNLALFAAGLVVGIRCYKHGTMRKLPGFLVVLGASAVVLQVVWLLVRFGGQALTSDTLFVPVTEAWAILCAYQVASFTVLALMAWVAAFVVWLYDYYRGFAVPRHMATFE